MSKYGNPQTGMTQKMWDAWCEACEDAGICPPKFAARPRIVQTIGTAPASKGYHAKDGILDGKPYCAAIDISVKGFTDPKKRQAQIKWLLFHMAMNGYVGWYRHDGAFANNQHIHAVFVGHPMKPQLESQVIDFFNDRTGLVGHATEKFWTASGDVDNHLADMFAASNPEAAKRIPAKYQRALA